MRCDPRVLMLVSAALILATAAGALAPLASAEDGDGSSADETADTSAGITAYGYVSDVSNPAGNIALADVEVALYDSAKDRIDTAKTGSDGMFEFSIEKDTVYYLSFELEGYAVRNVNLPGSNSDTTEGMYSFTATDDLLQTDGRYALTGSATSTYAVAMAVTNGVIYGNVYGAEGDDTFSVNGARVTATSADGRSYTTTTNDDGYFQLEVAFGSYTVRVSCTGFHDSDPVETSTSASSALSVTLTEKKMSLGLFGNLDTPHSLLVVGMLVLAAVLLLSFLAYKRSQRPDSGISIVEELEPSEGEVKRP